MDGSTIGMFARLIFSLGIIFGLMWIAANVLRKRGIAPSANRKLTGTQVELLARKPMGRNTSIAVVRIGERSMVVGVTEHYITKLDDADVAEIDLEEAGAPWTAPAGANGSATAWKAMLEQLRTRTTRR